MSVSWHPANFPSHYTVTEKCILHLNIAYSKKETALPSKALDCAILCKRPTISLCLNYNSTIVGRLRIWWGEGDVSSSVTLALGGETMQMDRPANTGLEQDVHLNLKNFKQVSKLDERVVGTGPSDSSYGRQGVCKHRNLFWSHFQNCFQHSSIETAEPACKMSEKYNCKYLIFFCTKLKWSTNWLISWCYFILPMFLQYFPYGGKF